MGSIENIKALSPNTLLNTIDFADYRYYREVMEKAAA